MKTASLILLALLSATPAVGQHSYYAKRDAVFTNRSQYNFRVTLLKANPDYLIVSNPQRGQFVVWVTRYSMLEKEHRGFFAKTRKAYIEELVPGTNGKLAAVRDEEGRFILKRLIVNDTIQEYEPAP
jgi:hypothetical protein